MRISDWSSDVCSSDLRQRIALRAEVRRELRIMRLQMIDQRLRVVDAEQFGGRGDAAVVEMGRDHSGRIDDGIARGASVVLRRLGSPQRVEPEGRVQTGRA